MKSNKLNGISCFLVGGSKNMKLRTKILSQSSTDFLNDSIQKYENDGWSVVHESLAVAMCQKGTSIYEIKEVYSIAVVKYDE
jgi:hypothetical protein